MNRDIYKDFGFINGWDVITVLGVVVQTIGNSKYYIIDVANKRVVITGGHDFLFIILQGLDYIGLVMVIFGLRFSLNRREKEWNS